jgi:PTS system nitrogen regulatory IIA component
MASERNFTFMLEALAALEQTVQALKKPIDILPLSTRLMNQRSTANIGPALEKYITPSQIEPDLKGETKEAIIDELLMLLVRNGLLRNVDEARKAVWDRENSMSTGLHNGIAIPHGKTDAVETLVCAMGIKRKGIDFKSMDGQLSTIFFLTLSPASKPSPYMQFMAMISQMLDSHGRDRLLACKTANEMYKVLTSRKISKEPEAKQGEAEKTPGVFELEDYLKPEVVVPHLKGNTREEVIDELLGELEHADMLHDRQAAKEAVLSREDLMPTTMGEGIAIPHGKTDAVDNLVCAVGVKPEGVDFGSRDGEPSKIIVMALTTEKGTAPYLQFTASIMRALNEKSRKKILHTEVGKSFIIYWWGKMDIDRCKRQINEKMGVKKPTLREIDRFATEKDTRCCSVEITV